MILFNCNPRPLKSLMLFLFLFAGFSTYAQDVTISGFIKNSEGEPVYGVPVLVNGVESTTSDAVGYYSVEVPTGEDYVIQPFYDENFNHQVTMTDFLMIVKHILFIDQITDPYKLIAADLNNSCSLSAFDLVFLRKVILSVETSLSNNTSWRFFDASSSISLQDFPCGGPVSFESVTFSDLQSDVQGLDWVAVKIGDLNGSAYSVE